MPASLLSLSLLVRVVVPLMDVTGTRRRSIPIALAPPTTLLRVVVIILSLPPCCRIIVGGAGGNGGCAGGRRCFCSLLLLLLALRCDIEVFLLCFVID